MMCDANQHTADMDMMEIGNGVMTELEEQTHFSFWAALKSPLIVGADVITMNQSSVDILINTDLIAISQDRLGTAVRYLSDLSIENEIQIWGGPLSSGKQRFVVLALNYGNATADVTIHLASVLGLSVVTNKKYTVKEVWSNKAVRPSSGTIALTGVEVGQTKVLVFSEA
jgi:alpha-galactosidase